MKMKNLLTINIENALEKRTECPLCYLNEKDENRFLETFYSEWVMDPILRENIIEVRGFCRYHWHQLLRFAEAHPEKFGLALVQENLVREHLMRLELLRSNARRLTNAEEQRKHRCVFRRMLIRRESMVGFAERVFNDLRIIEERCPACRSLSESTRTHIRVLIQMLVEDQGFRDAFKGSNGLCLSHLIDVVQIASRKAREKDFASIIDALLLPETEAFRRLRFELSEFIRKHDYRFASERWGSEKDVVDRVTLKLAGSSRLVTLG